MAVPTSKSSAMIVFLDLQTKNPRGWRGSILADECTQCCQPATMFNDKLSVEEYRISGLCQTCQDRVFTTEE